ncbi:MAG: DUF4886 domain-containing protein [Clostridia bacterium]|nr:DUF4886 domain-containing protein [Clostridia bacterium]MBQ7101365.1 DUF4886 domain-containing protein [Clostridia bacterium]
MNILSIGNSFSTDAHRYLHRLAELNGIEMKTVNLFIGGCDLETHWKNAEENNVCYDMEINGNEAENIIGIAQALNSDKWDIITLQQASKLSGIFKSTEPYLTNLAQYVRKLQPQAKLYYHQTWAYETDAQHTGFLNYGNDQNEMYRCIKETACKAAANIKAEIIPAGDVIQQLRKTKEFDCSNGGISLCRDGYHLSFDYGRFAAAATWLRTLNKKELVCQSFDGLDTELINVILNTVNGI